MAQFEAKKACNRMKEIAQQHELYILVGEISPGLSLAATAQLHSVSSLKNCETRTCAS